MTEAETGRPVLPVRREDDHALALLDAWHREVESVEAGCVHFEYLPAAGGWAPKLGDRYLTADEFESYVAAGGEFPTRRVILGWSPWAVWNPVAAGVEGSEGSE